MATALRRQPQPFLPDQTASFDWIGVSGSASYQIQIGGVSDFSPLALDRTVTTSQLTISMLSSSNCYGRARAYDSVGGPGAWSSAPRFSVN